MMVGRMRGYFFQATLLLLVTVNFGHSFNSQPDDTVGTNQDVRKTQTKTTHTTAIDTDHNSHSIGHNEKDSHSHGKLQHQDKNHHSNSSRTDKKEDDSHIDCHESIHIYFHSKDKDLYVKKCKDHGHAEEEHHSDRYELFVVDYERVQLPIMLCTWILMASIGKIGFHMAPKLSKMFPESCMLIVLGVVIGLLLFYTHAATVSPLTADVFFIYMLPPIILEAGYFMPNRLFFDHLGTILMFAVVGTIWNALTIGISLYALDLTGIFGLAEPIPVLHMLLFSSLISAVDPVAVLAVFEEIHVEEVLFILVFGESLLNDGITVVLYHMFEGFSHLGQENLIPQDYAAAIVSFFLVALGGTAIGIIWGFLTAFVTRFTKDVSVIEPVFIFVMSYLAYLTAEIFHFSGILSITFCGIAMKNYTSQNMSTNSQITVKYAMKMLAQSSETIIFMFLGVSTVHDNHDFNVAFVCFTILFCTIYRIMGTVMLSAVVNTFRVQKIDATQKLVIAYGGLRGAVAFALVLTVDSDMIPAQNMFVTTTICVVYWTVFVQGITIKPVVQYMGVRKKTERKLTMNERLHERVMDYIMAGIDDITGKHGNFYIRDKFKRFNNKYLTPCLVRENVWNEPKLLETFKEIKMDEAMSYMHNSGKPHEQVESFSALYRETHVRAIQESKQSHDNFNLDISELHYQPTAKDINEANFHHMLSSEYHAVKNRRHGGTYKRHAVKEEEINAKKTHRNQDIRLRTPTNKKYFVKAKKEAANGKVAEGEPVTAQKVNGTAITLKQDEIQKKMRDNPAFQPDETDPDSYDGIAPLNYKRASVRGPVIAETTLPWRRHINAEPPTKALVVQRRQSVDTNNDHTPTMAEVLLPWKRDEDEEDVRQASIPAWAHNEDYVNTDSPSNTYLRKIGENVKPSIHEIFKKRNSSASLYSIDESSNGINHSGSGSPVVSESGRRRGYHHSDSRRSSTKDEAYWRSAVSDNARRGMSMKERSEPSSRRERSEPNSRRSSVRDSHSNQDSPSHGGCLLNTAIKEEGPIGGTSPVMPPRVAEHVINMDTLHQEDSSERDETKF